MIPLLVSVALAAPIEGRVLERGTGTALPDAVVTATFPDQGEIQVVPDATGRFRVDWPAGTPVRIYCGGHEPYDTVVPEEGAPWVLFLRRGPAGVEIVVEARRDDPAVTEQRLDRERVQQTPGTHDDPFRLVQSLPGVTQTAEYSPRAGDIAVRGGGPGDNRYLLDGIDLPYLYHYNQYSSVIHTRLLDELTLYPSTFGAPYGDATGAVLDTRSVHDVPDRLRASANLNTVMGGAEIAAPLAPDWALRVSGRRSYLDLIEGSSLQYTVFPKFGDWYGRLEHRLPDGTRLAFVGIGASDFYSRYAGEPTLLDPYENSVNPVLDFRQAFQIAAIQHENATDTSSLRGSVSLTAYERTGTLPDANARTLDYTLAVHEDGTRRYGEHLQLAGGLELRASRFDLEVDTDRAWPEVSREAPLLARGVRADERMGRVVLGGYVEPRWEIGDLRLSPGLRVDGDSRTGALVADPRLAARWRPAKDTVIRAAAGMYSQFPTLEQLSPTIGNPGFGPSRSFQAAAGLDQAIAGRWELGLDLWRRWLWDLVESPTGRDPVGGVRGDAMGLSFQTRYRLRDLFFAWASVDLSHSTRTWDGVTAVSDYDQPVSANLVASWTFLPTWNAGLRYRISSGLPYTDLVDGVYDATTDSYLPVEGPRNGARLPAYQKLDLHIEKRFELRTASITPYLEAWYVPQPNNVMYVAWRYDYDEVEEVHGPTFLPLLGVRGEL